MMLGLILAGAAPAVAEGVFTLVEEGRPAATVVTADHPGRMDLEAVAEFNHWVEKISGVPLPVKTESQWRETGGEGRYVAIGRSDLTREAADRVEKLKPEAARVEITPGSITLVGRDEAPAGSDLEWRGTYYAVRELVEKRFGVRNIWPGPSGEVHPVKKSLQLEPGEWDWEPKLVLSRRIRNGYSERLPASVEASLGVKIDPKAWTALNKMNEEWLLRQRINTPSKVRFGHAFTDWWEKYSRQHPDWFARPPAGVSQPGGKGVKLNFTNPGVLKQILADWSEQRERDPLGSKFLALCPNDSRGFCTRPESRAWDAPKEQALSDEEIWSSDRAELTDRHVRFANMVARQARKIDPEVMVTTYAYRNYRKPPEIERVDDNVLIAYVGGEGYYPDERFIVDEWKGWAEKGASLFWRPNLLCGGHGMPFLYARQLRDDFATFQENGMLGTNFDGGTANWANQGLNYYVLAQMHFRSGESYDTFLDEYCAAFGPAAETVKAYFAFAEERASEGVALMREHRLVPRETWGGWWQAFIKLVPLMMTPGVAAEGEQLLAKAEAEVAGKEAIFRERVAFLRRGFDHAKKMAEVLRKVDFQRPAETPRAVLEPLWKDRLASLTDLAIPSGRLLLEEQRQFSLWNGMMSKVPQGKSLKLTSGWLLKADPDEAGEKEKWQQAAGEMDGWMPVSVGMPWAETAAGQAILKGTRFPTSRKVVWYRREVELPELNDTTQRLMLRFGAVDAEVKVWVDGVALLERGYPHQGNYDSWKTPFEVDLSSVATGGKKSWVVVRVASDRANGGVTGPVELLFD